MRDPLVAFARRQRGSKKRFRKRLGSLGYRSYAEYLGSPHWQAKKREFRRSKQVQSCRRCGNSRVQLHHMTYERVGDEHLEDLIPLCDDCHELLHRLEDGAIVGLDGREPPPVRPDPPPMPPHETRLEFWYEGNRHPQRDGQVRPDPTTANGGATASAKPVANPDGEAASETIASRTDP